MGFWDKAKELAYKQGFGKRYKGKYRDDDDYEGGYKGNAVRAIQKAVRRYLKKD